MSIDVTRSIDLRTTPNDPETRELVLESRRELLRTLGFSDDFIGKLEVGEPTLHTKGFIDKRITGLKERGFKDPVKLITKLPVVLSLTLSNIDEKITGLKERGFKDPVKLITSHPSILNYTFPYIDEKITGLKERGFKDPVKLTAKKPTIFSYAFPNIDAKIEGLKERGFKNPVKLVTAHPSFFSLALSYIDKKMEGLEERGFRDPVRLITANPSLIGYSFPNIDAKMEGLKERGFKDPVKMITKLPTLFGYAFPNIDRKINMLKRLTERFNLNIDWVEAIESFPAFVSYKIDKLWATARIMSEKAKSHDEVTYSKISQLLTTNLENLVLAARSNAALGLTSLIGDIRRVKKQGLSKEEKRQRIAALPDDDMLKKRYFRGYPMKAA